MLNLMLGLVLATGLWAQGEILEDSFDTGYYGEGFASYGPAQTVPLTTAIAVNWEGPAGSVFVTGPSEAGIRYTTAEAKFDNFGFEIVSDEVVSLYTVIGSGASCVPSDRSSHVVEHRRLTLRSTHPLAGTNEFFPKIWVIPYERKGVQESGWLGP